MPAPKKHLKRLKNDYQLIQKMWEEKQDEMSMEDIGKLFPSPITGKPRSRQFISIILKKYIPKEEDVDKTLDN